MARRALAHRHAGIDLARLASALADASRVAMIDVLLDGDDHAIGDLARAIGVSASTASSHLARLDEAGLVRVDQIGRERRVRLASAEVAHVIEQLAALAAPPAVALTAGARRRADELRFARTCYDHLAGVLGVLVSASLVERGWLRAGDFAPARPLLDWLASHHHGVDDGSTRPIARACLDGTERVHHLAGAAGAGLAKVFVANRWVARVRDSRALRVTTSGRRALADELDLQLPLSLDRT